MTAKQTLPDYTEQRTAGRDTTLTLFVTYPKRLLLMALGLGWAVDLLFYGRPLGINLWILTELIVAAFFLVGWWEKKRPQGVTLWLLPPLFFFAAMAAIRANGFLTTLNALAVLALLSYLAFFYGNGRLSNLGVLGQFLLPPRVASHSLSVTTPVVRAGVDTTHLRRRGRRNLLPVLRGLLLAFPVVLIFTWLLASADLIFADLVQDVLNLQILAEVVARFWRGILILLVAWVLAGALGYALFWRDGDESDQGRLEQALADLPRHASLGLIETGTILTLVNFLFATFVAVQARYLFGGTAVIERGGYTYADYARRGFFELVAVAVLSLALLLGLNWITRRASKQQIRRFNGLASLLIGFVGVMLISALQRMWLYEQAFGYTQLRLLVYVFMVWLGLLLVWFVFTLWRRPSWFAPGIVVAGIGFLATLNLLNPHALIVQRNLARYEQSGDLDVVYLTTLSADAVPGLLAAKTAVADDPQLVTAPPCDQRYGFDARYSAVRGDGCQQTMAQILQEELDGRVAQLEDNAARRSGPGFHLAYWRASRLLGSANSGQE